ncbi:MAG TPA: hypothetical protein DCX54_04605 [Flavobacteriales bacterium]|nr:hypothetical protein [Flavobacteriales bacterium]
MIKHLLIYSILLSVSKYSTAQCNTVVFSDTVIANTTDTVYINSHYENIWVCEDMNVVVLIVGNIWIEANCHVEILGGASHAYIKAPGYLKISGGVGYYERGVTYLDINGGGRACDSMTFDYSHVSANDCTIFTNVDEEKNISGVALFPNPNNGIFSVSCAHSKKSTLSIYSMMGELVHYEYISNSGKREINLQTFPHGIYLVELRTEKGIVREKVIIQ